MLHRVTSSRGPPTPSHGAFLGGMPPFPILYAPSPTHLSAHCVPAHPRGTRDSHSPTELHALPRPGGMGSLCPHGEQAGGAEGAGTTRSPRSPQPHTTWVSEQPPPSAAGGLPCPCPCPSPCPCPHRGTGSSVVTRSPQGSRAAALGTAPRPPTPSHSSGRTRRNLVAAAANPPAPAQDIPQLSRAPGAAASRGSTAPARYRRASGTGP